VVLAEMKALLHALAPMGSVDVSYEIFARMGHIGSILPT
jgi:hypothetical protein